MKTTKHQKHIETNRSHNNCPECRADTERRGVDIHVWQYGHVHDYLAWIRPRLTAIHAGEHSIDAQWWHRRFLAALHERISLKVPVQVPARYGRKHSDGYLERLRSATRGRGADEAYLRRFAQHGASCLD